MGIKQGTTQIDNVTEAAKGTSGVQRIKNAYPDSPVYGQTGDQLTEDGTLKSKMREWYSDNVLNVGTDHGNPDFSGTSLDYATAPNTFSADAEGNTVVVVDGGNQVTVNTQSPSGGSTSPSAIGAQDSPHLGDGKKGTVKAPGQARTRAGGFDLTKMPGLGKAASTAPDGQQS